MAKTNQYKQRGNDILFQGGHDVDEFDHYYGPCGSDIRQSIAGPYVVNRDNPGGDGPLEVVQSNKRYKGQKGRGDTRVNQHLNQGDDLGE